MSEQQIDTLDIIQYNKNYEVLHYSGLFFKRTFDIIVSTILLIIFSPIICIAAILIKIDSRGPAFFIQQRVGTKKRKFSMFKLRSMTVDAEQRWKDIAHMNQLDGPVFKIKNDPRITRIGNVIRKTSIDELPQLINVLFGDMSLVGPRPALPHELNKYNAYHFRRLTVKPGITGLWQVSGRNNIPFEEWIKLDLKYIDEWTPWMDIKILALTVPAVISQKGAH